MDYGLIGHPLGHSYSKEIHSFIADYDYELCDIAPEELDCFMRSRPFRAINVTIPYKQAVIPYLSHIDPEAMAIGAVNTIVNRGGELWGYNTDIDGMAALAKRIGMEFRGRKVLILGTGGTSKTAQFLVRSKGAGEVLTVSRSGKEGSVSYDEAVSLHCDADYIINTTPVGMYPNTDAAPVDLCHFSKLGGVLDVVYNPQRTSLVLQAQELGIPADGGLYMLSSQAVYASALFLGKTVDPADTGKAFRGVRDGKRNIVLLGMPSCGKTTVSNILSDITGKQPVDTDSMITDRIGMTISEFFEKFGESAFRDVESQVIREAARLCGVIISTGGGAVLRKDNVDALRRSGITVFIDRSPEKLIATSDRPLSSDRDALARRYNERIDRYIASGDVRVDGDGTPSEVADAILREIEK